MTDFVSQFDDPVGSTDSFSAGYGPSFTDTTGLTDSVSQVANYTLLITDTTGSTDTLATAKNTVLVIQDFTWPTDGTVRTTTYLRTVNDPAGATDAAATAATFPLNFTDTTGSTDTMSKGFFVDKTDTTGSTDSSTQPKAATFAQTDDSGLTDTSVQNTLFAVNPTDTTGITDSASSIANFSLTTTDTTGLTDTQTRATSFVLVFTDTTGSTDTNVRATAFTFNQTDTTGSTDTRTSISNFANTQNWTVGLTDSYTKIVVPAPITDTTGSTDNYTLKVDYDRTLPTDTTGLTDTVATATNFVLTVTDNMNQSDVATTVNTKVLVITDGVGLSSERMTMADTTAVVASNFLRFGDVTRITDNIVTFTPLFVNLAGPTATSVTTAPPGTVLAVKVTVFGGGKSAYPWRYVKPLPTPRVFSASTAVANKLYLFGGVLETGVVTTEALMYDYATDTWTSLTPMPGGKTNAAAAALDGKIMIAAGLGTDLNPDPTSYIYNIDTDSWSTGPVTPSVWGHTLVAHAERNEIYFFGGYSRSKKGTQNYGLPTGNGVVWNINRPIRGGSRSGSDKLQKYVYFARMTDPQFTAVGNLAQGMALHSTSRIGNSFYHAGGNGFGIPTGVAQVWSIGDISALLTPGPLVGAYSSASAYNDTVFFHGGGNINVTNGQITVSAQTIGYDTTLQSWGYYPDMEAPRLGCTGGTLDTGLTPERPLPVEIRKQGVTSVGSVLYSFGGEKLTTGNTYSFTPTADMYIYDTIGTTVLANNMPMALTNVTAEADGNTIYIVGNNGGVGYFWSYDTTSGTFTSLPVYDPSISQGGAMCVIYPYVYFFQNGQSTNPVMKRYHVIDKTWEDWGGYTPFTGRTDVDQLANGALIYLTTQGEMYTFDTINGTYATRSAAPLTDPKFKIAIFQNYIHAISQTDGSRWYYNLTTNTWTKLTRRIYPHLYSGLTATADKLYFIGGYNPGVTDGGTPFSHPIVNIESWSGTSGYRSIVAGGEIQSIISVKTPQRLNYTEVLSVAPALPPKRAGITVNPLAIFYDDVPSYLL